MFSVLFLCNHFNLFDTNVQFHFNGLQCSGIHVVECWKTLELLEMSIRNGSVKDILVSITRFSRSSPPEVFLGRSVLKICSKFTREQPCRNAISIKLQRNFIETALRYGCFPVNLQHIFRTPFPKTTSGGLLLLFTTNKSTRTSNICPQFFLFSLKLLA